MTGKDEETGSGMDEYEAAKRVNLRDYPGTALVLISVFGSSCAWMLYNWLGRKKTTKESPAREGTKDPGSG